MRLLFYLTAVVCLAGWAVSVFIYSASDLIHSLLAFSVIFATLGVMGDEKPVTATPSESDFKI